MRSRIEAAVDRVSLLHSLNAEVEAFKASTDIPDPVGHDESALDGYIAALRRFQGDLHRAGLPVPAWPSRYGGRDLDPAAACAVAQRLGELGAPELVNFVGIEVLAPGLLRYVDDNRLDRWLPPMACAEELWCQLFSEPDAGSDLASLRTVAEPDGMGWKLSGQNIWSTWGQHADWGLILARTGSVEERHRGITAFVIDMHQDGIDARPLRSHDWRSRVR